MKEEMEKLLIRIILLITACTPPIQQPNPEQSAAVLLRLNHPYCGAVAVSPHHLVTTEHCMMGATIVEYLDQDGWRFWNPHSATLIRTDKPRDLALLETEYPLTSWSKPRTEELVAGEPVCTSARFTWICGKVIHPLTLACVDRGNGKLCSKKSIEAQEWLTETDLPTWVGLSGSGVWDAQGRIVGITVAATNNRGLHVRPRAILFFLTIPTKGRPLPLILGEGQSQQ